MRHLLLLAAVLPATAVAQATPTSPTHAKIKPAKCERPSARRVAGAPQGGLHKLGEMPTAKPIYTVLRQVDGCPTPVSVRPR